MQEAELRAILAHIPGAGTLRPGGTNHVKFSCILAPWTHGRGTDRKPSMTATIGPGVSLLKCHACRHLASLADTLLRLNTYSGGQYAALALRVKSREHELALQDIDFTQINDPSNLIRTDPDLDYTPFLAQLIGSGLTPWARDTLASKGVDPDFAAEQYYCASVPAGYHDDGMGLDRRGYLKTTRTECLLFPVLTAQAGTVRCLGAQVRPVNPEPLKYWTIWPFVAGRHLFGEHFLPYLNHRPLSLVEGPFDAMHLMQIGAWSVGLNGLAFSTAKANLIRAAEPSLVGVLLDPDEAGVTAARNVNKLLTEHGVPSMLCNLDQDPKNLTRDDLVTHYPFLI